jgi:hypothetical protein
MQLFYFYTYNRHPIHPDVDFTSILSEAFMGTDPKSVKKTDNLTVLFVLKGSARKMLMRLTRRH